MERTLSENWDDKYEYLRDAVFLYHNRDYWEFLIRNVWRLDKMCRVIDFGCGYGISHEAADKEIQRELDRDFLHKGRDYHTVWPGLLTFSYGTVTKSKAPGQ
ncbi:MAG: hypothetical protein SVV80_13130 [Planctomycetota bacterium]|nr:hypothetical protein [Planctomycetota bacterium]